MTPAWDTACPKLGLPPCPMLTKEATTCCYSISLIQACARTGTSNSNPAGKPSCSFSPGKKWGGTARGSLSKQRPLTSTPAQQGHIASRTPAREQGKVDFATAICKLELQEELWFLPCSLPSFKQLPTPHQDHQRHHALTAAWKTVLRGQVSAQSGDKSEGMPLEGNCPR